MRTTKISHTGEIRIPSKLLSSAIAGKKNERYSSDQLKTLQLVATAKLHGHRIAISRIRKLLRLKERTTARLIKSAVARGWVGTDGTYIFPRSWYRLNLKRRGGLYLTVTPKNFKRFEALCFAKVLKKLYQRVGGLHAKKGSVLPDLPAWYIARELRISPRRLVALKATSQRYRFISVKPQYTVVGKGTDFYAIKKNLPGLPVFRKGKHTVVAELSKIRVLI